MEPLSRGVASLFLTERKVIRTGLYQAVFNSDTLWQGGAMAAADGLVDD